MIAFITKEFAFSASHQLDGLPDGHQCARLHGHNYVLKVGLTGDVKPPGFVVDYGDLGFIKTWVDEKLDHKHLNDVFDFNPTAEHIAYHAASILVEELAARRYVVQSVSVSVSETPKTWATVTLPMADTVYDSERYRWGRDRGE